MDDGVAGTGSADAARLERHRRRAAPYLEAIPAHGDVGLTFPRDEWILHPHPSLPWFAAILAAPAPVRAATLIAVYARVCAARLDDPIGLYTLPVVAHRLAREAAPLGREDVRLVLALGAGADLAAWRTRNVADVPAAVLETFLATGEPLDDLTPDVRALLAALDAANPSDPAARPARAAFVAALSGSLGPEQAFHAGDSWGVGMRDWLAAHRDAGNLVPLLAHLAAAESIVPTARWQAAARPLLAVPGAEALVRQMIESSFEARLTIAPVSFLVGVPGLQPANASLLRGAYWAAATAGWSWATDALARGALHWGTSARENNVAREPRLANSCTALLGAIGTPEAVAALAHLKAKVRNRGVAKTVARTLGEASARLGTSPSELVELAVPRLGLDAEGRREIGVGDAVAALSIGEDGVARVRWRYEARETDSPPPALKAAEPSAVRDVARRLDELRKALGVERARLEDLPLEDRTWPFRVWRERYLGHPLTASIARRLVWRFASAHAKKTAIPLGGGLVDASGEPIPTPPDDVVVSLWHPLGSPADDVARWRSFVLERRIRQPFRQAFREVYALTPAERETPLYSNRFAGHILAYPQARALMTARRWASNYLGPYESGFAGVARRDFPVQRLRAEFLHEPVEEGLTVSSVTRCSTDQVRFYALGGRQPRPVPLADVPPLVYSEAMRDVDLFVSVTTIAADANWRDAGLERGAWLEANRQAVGAAWGDRFEAYWQAAAFAELPPSAETRAAVLRWVVPQLPIRDRLELDERWLRVCGDAARYRIHLGSGSVLAEPDATEPFERFLRLTPERRHERAAAPFVPFDDDPILSVILARAFTLAER